MSNLLNIQSLSISFPTEENENKVLKNISFDLNSNEILGIIGESGSGKSVSSLAILGLLPKNKAKVSGSILFEVIDYHESL